MLARLASSQRQDVDNRTDTSHPPDLLTDAGQPAGAVRVVAAGGLAVSAIACRHHDSRGCQTVALDEPAGGSPSQRCAACSGCAECMVGKPVPRAAAEGQPTPLTHSPPACIRDLVPDCSALNSSRSMNSRLADAHWAQTTRASRTAAAAFILQHDRGRQLRLSAAVAPHPHPAQL